MDVTLRTPPPAHRDRLSTCRLILPADFEAFYLLHHKLYLRYALHHLDPVTAHDVVATVFGNLATHWCRLLRHPNLSSHAWQLFRSQACLRARREEGENIHQATRPLHYDTAVLHQHLGYPLATVAAAIGEETSTLRSALRLNSGRNLAPRPVATPPS